MPGTPRGNSGAPPSSTDRPRLLIDVDGVLNLDRDATDGWESHDVRGPRDDGRVYRLTVNPLHGEWLLELAAVFSLTWCSTWGRVANARISPLLHLPDDLDVVPLPATGSSGIDLGMSPKTPWVRRWASTNHISTLAWLDDDVDERVDQAALTREISHDERSVLAGTAPVMNALVVKVRESEGLTRRHVDRLLSWTVEAAWKSSPS